MKRIAIAIGLVLLATTMFAADKSWTGYVTSEHCASKGNPAAHAKGCVDSCLGKEGAKAVLLTDSDNKVVKIANQDKVKDHAAHHVTVTGKLEGDTLTIDTLKMVEEKKN